MATFMGNDFLLNTDIAKTLYHQYAKDVPVYDYHCHLSPEEIARDRRFANITEAWLGGDHYKWRAMRWCGVPESHITGNAEPKEKFLAWARTMEKLIGHPLYAWAHLELSTYFGIETPLSSKTAEDIWEKANAKLAEPAFSCRGLIKASNVAYIGTTDDPADSLSFHKELMEDASFHTVVAPTFRPDKAYYIERGAFLPWLAQLEGVCGTKIGDLSSLRKVLASRMDHFASHGGGLTDHSLEPVEFEEGTEEDAARAFADALAGNVPDAHQLRVYKTRLMQFVAGEAARRGWVMQLHLGCLRNNNTEMFGKVGVDAGFDTVDDVNYIRPLAKLLDSFNSGAGLPNVVLYNLNPRDNTALATLAGCFQGKGVEGRVQFGTAWWFNDHVDGMTRQIKDLANLGALGVFLGMLTDSRSFTSYPRHAYFRRILCRVIGEWVENGEVPADVDMLGGLVKDICGGNVAKTLKLEK